MGSGSWRSSWAWPLAYMHMVGTYEHGGIWLREREREPKRLSYYILARTSKWPETVIYMHMCNEVRQHMSSCI